MYQGHIGWIAQKRQEVNKYELWRGIAKMNNLSAKAHLRLEWIIFYLTIAKQNATLTCRHFGISRSVFSFLAAEPRTNVQGRNIKILGLEKRECGGKRARLMSSCYASVACE